MLNPSLAWAILLVSGILECGWAIGLKYSEGFTRLVPSLLTVVALGGSFGGLTFALRALPTGTAYAVWTGIGAAGTATLGMILFNEGVSALRLASIGLIICGIIGLRLAE